MKAATIFVAEDINHSTTEAVNNTINTNLKKKTEVVNS